MFSLIPWRNRANSGALATRERDPFRLLNEEFQGLMNRFFSDNPLMVPETLDYPRVWGLEFNEGEKDVTVRAELPGFDVKDLDVHLTENVLTIEAKHGEEGKDEDFRHVRRSLTIPAGLDVEKIEANYKNGVLELKIPRLPETQSRRIEVKV